MPRLLSTPRSAFLVIMAGVIFVVAVLFALFRLALPLLPALQEEIAARASTALGAPVIIGSMDARWSGFGPELEFNDVELTRADGSGNELLSFTRMRVGLYLTDLLLGRGLQPRELELAGLRMVVEKRLDGAIALRGLSGASQKRGDFIGGLLESLKRRSHWEFKDTQVIWVRETSRGFAPGELSIFDIEVNTDRDIVSAEMSGHPPSGIGESLTVSGIAFGDLSDPVNLPFEIDVDAAGLDLSSPWLSDYVPFAARLLEGRADIFLNVEWRGQQLLGATGDVVAHDLIGVRSLKGDDRLGLSGDFLWRPVDEGWRLVLDDTAISYGDRRWPTRSFEVQTNKAEGTLLARAAYLDLADMQVLARTLLTEEERPPAILYEQNAYGVVQDAEVQLQRQDEDWSLLSTRGRFDGLALTSHGKIPGFSGLTGHWTREGTQGEIHLQSADLILDTPSLYEDAVRLDELSGVLAWEELAAGAQVKTDNLKLVLDGIRFETVADVAIQKDRPPAVDLTVNILDLTLEKGREYLPKIIPERAREWLEQALVAGQVSDAVVRLQGDPTRFPFTDGGGEFTATATLTNGVLRYEPRWPDIEQLAAKVDFHNASLRVADATGLTRGAKVYRASAELADLFAGVVKVTVAATGNVPTLLKIARTTPLQEPLSDVLDGLSGEGRSEIDLKVTVPVKTPDQVSVTGQLRLLDTILERSEAERLTAINGALDFTHSPSGTLVEATAVKARYLDLPLALNLEARGDDPNIKVTATGQFDLAEPAARSLAESLTPAWVPANLDGQSAWTADLSGTSEYPPAALVSIETDLVGVASRLPFPLTKDAMTPLAYKVIIDRRVDDVMQVNYRAGPEIDALASGAFWLQSSPSGWVLERGEQVLGAMPAQLPEKPGLSVGIDVPAFNMDRWVVALGGWNNFTSDSQAEVLAETDVSGLEPASLNRVTLSTQHLRAFDLDWTAVDGDIARRVGGWLVKLDADQGTGSIRLPAAGSETPLKIEFSRLYLDQLGPSRAPPGDQPFTTEQALPADLPSMDIFVGDFRYRKLRFGSLGMDVRPTLGGIQFNRIATSGGQVQINGSGRWVYLDGEHLSEVRAEAASTDLKSILEDIGYAGTVGADQTEIAFRMQWPAPLSGPTLANVGGEFWLRMDDGILYGVEPGPGRIFGLFSFYTLPRRFLLNFRDLLEPGTTFDKLHGNFVVNGGNAWTKDLKIEAPGFDLEMVGRTGLVDQDYDQRIKVNPDLSSGVVLAAAATAGLGVGAVILIGQQLFGKPLGDLGQFNYHLHGSWDDPLIGDKPINTDKDAAAAAVAKPRTEKPRSPRRR